MTNLNIITLEPKINHIVDKELTSLFKEIKHHGGCVNFFIYNTNDTEANPYAIHREVAKQSLENVSQLHTKTKKSSNEEKAIAIDDFSALATSGKQISIEEFLGPYFDYDLKKPLVRGVEHNNTLNSYFLYDQLEILQNAIAIDKRFEEHNHKYPGSSNGFTYAFLEPPYGFGRNKTIHDKGLFFLSAIEQLFSTIESIEIYTWSTDCSPYFDLGNEWWGSFFYTIYNPTKDIYIGILASTSD
jgi:hypothetical protein